MQQVANCKSILLSEINYNLFFVLGLFIVFVSHSNILLGRDDEGTSLYRDLFSLDRDVRLSLS